MTIQTFGKNNYIMIKGFDYETHPRTKTKDKRLL